MSEKEKKEQASTQIRIKTETLKKISKIISDMKYGKELFKSNAEFINFLLSALIDDEELLSSLLARGINKKEQ